MSDERVLQDVEIKVSKHSESIRVLFSALEGVNKSIETLRVDLQNAVREVSALEGHVDGNSQRAEQIMNELTNLVKSVAVASASIDNVESVMDGRKDDGACIATMRERCDILTREIQKKICEMQTILEELKGRVTALEYETVNEAVQKKFAQVDEEMKSLRTAVEELKAGDAQEAGVRKFLVHALPIIIALVGVAISIYTATKN